MTFCGEILKFFRETPKKVVQKFRQKFAPPSVSEVLDPLVPVSTLNAIFDEHHIFSKPECVFVVDRCLNNQLIAFDARKIFFSPSIISSPPRKDSVSLTHPILIIIINLIYCSVGL